MPTTMGLSNTKMIALIAPDPEKGHRRIRFEYFAIHDNYVIATDCTETRHTIPWTSILRIEERKE